MKFVALALVSTVAILRGSAGAASRNEIWGHALLNRSEPSEDHVSPRSEPGILAGSFAE